MTAPDPVREPAGLATTERQARQPVNLPATAVFENGASIAMTLVDLSYDGAKVESPLALLPGLRFKLSVLRLGALDAEVRWCRDRIAGLRFAAAEPSALPVETPRSHPRIDLAGSVSLRRSGKHNYQARIFDLSPSGCRVEFVERPSLGESLWIRFDGLDSLEGTVRWLDGFYGGIEFNRHIYPVVYELLLARLGLR
ncbi:PilZ domain-containing protein [Sphingomonas ginkgonis]|uniref:PilZ domain-containing protein n=1 Tax=Sphingomonas ginkgonis TaxID=2315330 RepID=UPI00163A4C04|nr:PilZ domain-containing protein [Sphingomonas ginkgonis]